MRSGSNTESGYGVESELLVGARGNGYEFFDEESRNVGDEIMKVSKSTTLFVPEPANMVQHSRHVFRSHSVDSISLSPPEHHYVVRFLDPARRRPITPPALIRPHSEAAYMSSGGNMIARVWDEDGVTARIVR